MKKLDNLDALGKLFQDGSVYICNTRKYLEAAIQAIPNLKVHCLDFSKIIVSIAFKTFSLSHVNMDSVKNLGKPQSNMQEQSTAFEEDR